MPDDKTPDDKTPTGRGNPVDARAFELRESRLVQSQDERTGEITTRRKTELLGTFATEEAFNEYVRFRYPASDREVSKRCFERRSVRITPQVSKAIEATKDQWKKERELAEKRQNKATASGAGL